MRHPTPSTNERRPMGLISSSVASPRSSGSIRSRLAARCAWAGLLLCAAVAGCSSVELDEPSEPLTSVDTWQVKMTRQGTTEVVIAYAPPPSAQRQYTGANHQSDGKVLVVSLRSCLVSEECPTLLPSQVRSAPGQGRWYEVVVPYRGEQVVVDGDGPGKQVLSLTP